MAERFPYKAWVDHEARMIVLYGSGVGTTADTIKLIADEDHTFRDYPGYGVLYDAMALTIQSSAAEMVKVAEALFGMGAPPISRFAVFVPPARAPLAMIFTALAQSYGSQPVSSRTARMRSAGWRRAALTPGEPNSARLPDRCHPCLGLRSRPELPAWRAVCGAPRADY